MAKVRDINAPPNPPPYSEDPDWWVDERGVRYADNGVPYLTTHQLARELDLYPETVFRWCRKWFGPLPQGRSGAGLGYRIPLEYRMVARAWIVTEDVRLREIMRRSIVADPKDWVVVVANVGSTHYTDRETVGRMETLIRHPTFRGHAISAMYVGDSNKHEGA
jgi:hypothetical protein